MATYLWLCHSSGGNLPPSLGIAKALQDRGHAVTFFGKPEMIPRVAAKGFGTIESQSAYAQLDAYPKGSPLSETGCYLTSPAVSDEIRAVVETEAPDVLLVDAMFPAALSVAPSFGVPTIVFSHTFLYRQMDAWRDVLGKLAGLRAAAGFAPLPDSVELWQAHDRVIVTSVEAFDDDALPGFDHVRHVGPVLESEALATPIDLPWAEDDPTPLVLLSFTTTAEQKSADKVQKALDALADLPVHVLATTSQYVDPAELAPPANAHVVAFADHDRILARAALTITHGGHGTFMRALRHGVPMIVIPGFAHDQAPNAALAEELGVGLALPGDASGASIRAAAETILADPAFAASAGRCAAEMSGLGGAALAATEIEALSPRAAG